METPMKTLFALAALTVALPGLAAAEEESKFKAYTGTLEFSFGFGGTATAEPDKGDSTEADLATTLSITPGLDKMLGTTVGIGLEYGFNWYKGEDVTVAGTTVEDKNRQLVMTPMGRVRMAFPVYDKITFDGMFGIGAALWTADKDAAKDTPTDSLRVGWALRFNFGGSYQFNPSVAAFGSLGYMTTTSFGDDVSLTYATIPLNVGLRGGF